MIFEKNKVTKNEDIWKELKYKNYSGKQLYKRYRKIIFNPAVQEEIKKKEINFN